MLFSPEDLPSIRARIRKSTVGSMALIQQEELLKASWWNAATSDGQIFRKLSSGETNGLEWDCAPGTPLNQIPHQFKGEKPGIYNDHVAYVPECLTAMALHCLVTGDEEHGRQTAAAFVNYYRLREPIIDRWNSLSDSEFGASPYNGAGAVTCWRGMHGVCAHMNLGLGLDMAGKWMTPQEREDMRRIVVKATYGRRPYGQDSSPRFRDVNWVAWDLSHYLALAAIEGLPGVDPEGLQSDRETVRAFCDWGIDENGVIYESNGKTGGSLQFQLLSMVTLARRGENLFGHPHWRKFLRGQIQMTSPSGKVTVNSGTQYAPFSRNELSMPIVNQLKTFYPEERFADYLLSQSVVKSSGDEGFYHIWLPQTKAFDPVAYGREVRDLKKVRMPSLSYPGFVADVLYNSDYRVTSREDLALPLDFSDPVHGVFSSYSDRTTNAAWMNLLVRPDHYYGAGHHHADAGMFHFSSGGVGLVHPESVSSDLRRPLLQSRAGRWSCRGGDGSPRHQLLHGLERRRHLARFGVCPRGGDGLGGHDLLLQLALAEPASLPVARREQGFRLGARARSPDPENLRRDRPGQDASLVVDLQHLQLHPDLQGSLQSDAEGPTHGGSRARGASLRFCSG